MNLLLMEISSWLSLRLKCCPLALPSPKNIYGSLLLFESVNKDRRISFHYSGLSRDQDLLTILAFLGIYLSNEYDVKAAVKRTELSADADGSLSWVRLYSTSVGLRKTNVLIFLYSHQLYRHMTYSEASVDIAYAWVDCCLQLRILSSNNETSTSYPCRRDNCCLICSDWRLRGASRHG